MTAILLTIPKKSDLVKLKIKRLVVDKTTDIEALLDELNSLYSKDASIEKFVAPLGKYLVASKKFMKSIEKKAPKFLADFEVGFYDPVDKISKTLQEMSKYPNNIEKILAEAESNFTHLDTEINKQLDDSVLKQALELLFKANNGIGTVGSLCDDLSSELGIGKYGKASVNIRKITTTTTTIDKILNVTKNKQAYSIDKTPLIAAVRQCISLTQALKKDLAV